MKRKLIIIVPLLMICAIALLCFVNYDNASKVFTSEQAAIDSVLGDSVTILDNRKFERKNVYVLYYQKMNAFSFITISNIENGYVIENPSVKVGMGDNSEISMGYTVDERTYFYNFSKTNGSPQITVAYK